MKTKCYSYSGKCPCVNCSKNCYIESENKHGFTETKKLCGKAREYCERLAKENEHDE